MTYYSSDSLDFSHDCLTIMGRVAGFSLGAWSFQREWLAAERLESQRRRAALETLQELMVTLAHYIRNANLIIGGYSARLQKEFSDPQCQQPLEMIRRASHEIDAVLKSLESLTEVKSVLYVNSGQARIIDLQQELEARLAASRPGEPHET